MSSTTKYFKSPDWNIPVKPGDFVSLVDDPRMDYMRSDFGDFKEVVRVENNKDIDLVWKVRGIQDVGVMINGKITMLYRNVLFINKTIKSDYFYFGHFTWQR